MRERQTPFEIDVLLVSGARPELLIKTLESFNSRLFVNFKVNTVFANIDRFGGGEREILECERIIFETFGDAVIRKPISPSFTGAVKWLWESTSAPYCLHIEDDWLLHADVFPDNVSPLFDDRVRQVSFLTKEKKWNFNYPFHVKARRRKFLKWRFGWKLLEDEPVFTTSPSFLERSFANTCGRMMDLRFDPEKQLYRGINPEVQKYCQEYRNRLLWNETGFMIEDIGREYRSARGIEKKVVDGQSVWSNS